MVAERAPREDAVGGERGAAVRVAVADVDERVLVRQRAALAQVAALGTRRIVVPADPPAVRPRIEPVRDEVDLDAFPRQDRSDMDDLVRLVDHAKASYGSVSGEGYPLMTQQYRDLMADTIAKDIPAPFGAVEVRPVMEFMS